MALSAHAFKDASVGPSSSLMECLSAGSMKREKSNLHWARGTKGEPADDSNEASLLERSMMAPWELSAQATMQCESSFVERGALHCKTC